MTVLDGDELKTSVRHGPGWPMGPWAGLGMGLGWAYNLEVSTGSGRAWADKFQIIWIGRGSHLYSICHKPS